jgi:hypothetical protein
MRNALVIGINNYPTAPLTGCINDAEKIAELLNENEDGSKNFNTTILTDIHSKAKLKGCLMRFLGNNQI